MKKLIIQYLKRLGVLRLLLAVAAVVVAVFALEPGTRTIYEGWRIMPTLVLPAVAPIVFLTLLLDLMVAKIWIGEAADDERSRLRTVMISNIVLAAAILIAWLPFFIALRR